MTSFSYLGKSKVENVIVPRLERLKKRPKAPFRVKSLDLVVGADALSFAAYEETTLALRRTRQFSLQEIAASADPLTNLYDDAG